jgi:hypothetical protein
MRAHPPATDVGFAIRQGGTTANHGRYPWRTTRCTKCLATHRRTPRAPAAQQLPPMLASLHPGPECAHERACPALNHLQPSGGRWSPCRQGSMILASQWPARRARGGTVNRICSRDLDSQEFVVQAMRSRFTVGGGVPSAMSAAARGHGAAQYGSLWIGRPRIPWGGR